MSRLILVGGGGFAREVLEWTFDLDKVTNDHKVTHVIDDKDVNLRDFGYNIEYGGKISDFTPIKADRLIMAIASPLTKRSLIEKFLDFQSQFVSIVHPSAKVAKTACIERGSIICPFALISANVTIQEFVTINCHSTVGHDANIGSFTTLSGHVDITGQVQVEEGCFFGSGARVTPRRKIGKGAIIGAGCTVMTSIKEGKTYYTPPPRKLF